MDIDDISKITNGQIPIESVKKWLKCGSLPANSDVKLSPLAVTDKNDFSRTFQNFLRKRTHWFIKGQDINVSKDNDLSSTKFENVSIITPSGIQSPPSHNKDESHFGARRRQPLKLLMSPASMHDSSMESSRAKKCLNLTPKTPTQKTSQISESLSPPFESPVAHSPNCRTYFNRTFSPDSSDKSRSFGEDSPLRSRAKLSLGDFLTNSSSKKNKNRRIKPTKVTPEKVDANNPFTNAPEMKACEKNERLLLKKECDNLQQLLTSTPTKMNSPESAKDFKTPVKVNKLTSAQLLSEMSNSNNIDSVKKLRLLSDLYSFILSENLCDNVMTELHFILTLLSSTPEENAQAETPFESATNCIYFAVLMIEHLQNLLLLLSPALLHILADSLGISTFAPDLGETFKEACRNKLELSSSQVDVSAGGNVSFQSDTDNIDNFPSHTHFTSFRKQRDALYKLLENWETNPNMRQWETRVKGIVAIQDNPTNLLHLARLLRNQLLASCSIYSQQLNETECELLQLLPSTDREKLSRLEARLTVPRLKLTPVPKPDFPGRELFFYNFIKACEPGQFVDFFKLVLLDELMSLNDAEFCSSGNDKFTDDLTKKRYLECLSSTRLLAKFLAVAEFLPYKENDNLPESVLQLLVEVRKKALPLFDIEQSLRNAMSLRRIILTVPWIVSYMSMMDQVSALLPAYHKVWALLMGLSRYLPNDLTGTGRLLLRLNLDWFFQIVIPPPDIQPEKVECTSIPNALDEMDVISERALYSACPYLSSLNVVLAGTVGNTPRHIRPTPKTDQVHVEGLAAKQLELRLEESFLQNQSTSTRRTIQFVSERVASSCCKLLVSDVLSQMKSKLLENVNQLNEQNEKLVSMPKNAIPIYFLISINELLECKRSELMVAIEQWETEVKTVSSVAIRDICTPRAQLALRSLLGPDVSEQSTQAASDLVVRQTMEKVYSWMQSHVHSDSRKEELFKELNAIVEGKAKKVEIPTPLLKMREEPQMHFYDCISKLRVASWQALMGCLDAEMIQNTLIDTDNAVISDLPETLRRPMILLITDLILFIYINCPHLIEFVPFCVVILKKLDLSDCTNNPLSRLLCPRNINLLKDNESCKNLARFLQFLMQEQLLNEANVKLQIEETTNFQWPEELLLQLKTVLQLFFSTINADDHFKTTIMQTLQTDNSKMQQ